MPEDNGPAEADVSGTMSESENDYDDTELIKDGDDSMAEQNTTDGVDANGEPKKKYDPKDPLRPRRKKARRACYACQRAHLTCGDERPCQRCIKRGLADACQDGVRKKAKYLHDAPPEALRPVLGPNFDPNAPAIRPNGHRHPSNSGSEVSSNVGTFFSQQSTSQFPGFSTAQTPMGTLPESMPFGSQQSPVSPSFQGPGNPQMGSMGIPQVSSPLTSFPPALFDPNNPALFSFNLEGLNFGSHYGAMEFGMLGHMSSGAADAASRDPSLSQQGGEVYGSAGVFGNGLNQFDKVYDNGMMNDFLGLDQNANGLYSQGNLQHGLPHAYAIAAGPTSLQSPSTENNSPQPTSLGIESSPTVPNYSATTTSGGQQQQTPLSRPKPKTAAAKMGPQGLLGKRQRDPSYIYETVTDPFPYVESFHRVINMLNKRFSREKVYRIAKSLATIRPSFISCTKTLNRQDLVFMEKSFQRALFEYEEFMHQCSSPALACRRTGEVAGVNKEFTALTGWTKDVLLGKEPNNNVNTGVTIAGSSTSSTSGKHGFTTPLLKSMDAAKPADGQTQPVFLFELMDDDSVIDFYEDYAQLAFNNSRGKVVRKCRLLKYRTKDSVEGAGAGDIPEESPLKDPRNSILSNRVAKIDGEHGISKLEKDGKLECSYTWTIKRDTFDIPMMIIINFLPCYYRNHNQLAV